jgi:hypothetical protein
MFKGCFVLLLVLLACTFNPVLAMPVTGDVTAAPGDSAYHVLVRISQLGDVSPRYHSRVLADSLGHFRFPDVPYGDYALIALQPGHGFAAQEISVNTVDTVQNYALQLSGLNQGDTLTVVHLRGTAIVLPVDANHPFGQYLLDVNSDGTADYRLLFGPPWYHPAGGVARPSNGSEISIDAGLFSYGNPDSLMPPMVLVYRLNNLFWREPAGDNGGFLSGQRFETHPCESTDTTGNIAQRLLPRKDMSGFLTRLMCGEWLNPPGIELMASRREYGRFNLNLGARWTRPLFPGHPNNDLSIVGGLSSSDIESYGDQWVVVYEVDGIFVREPGDTTELNQHIIDSAIEPPTASVTSYLTVSTYPNPFNPVVNIRYDLPAAGEVRMSVFDLTGREVANLASGKAAAGSHTVAWDGSNAASGIYLYRVTSAGQTRAGRLMLLK